MFDRVVQLELRGPIFTDESVTDLGHLRHLNTLRLDATSISAEWVEQFQAAHPRCDVEHSSYGANKFKWRVK